MPFIQLAHCTHQPCVLPLCHQINKSCELKMVSFIWCVCADRLLSEEMWLLLFTIFIYSLDMRGGSAGLPDKLGSLMWGAGRTQNFTKICALKKSNSQNDFLSSSTTFRLSAHGMINLCLLSFILFSKGKVAHSEGLFPLFSYIQVVQCTLFRVTSSIPLNWNLFRWYSHAHVPSCARSYPATFILKEEDLRVDLHQEDKNFKK